MTDNIVEKAVATLWGTEFTQSPEEARQQSRADHQSDGWVDDFLDAMRHQVEALRDAGLLASAAAGEGQDREETYKRGYRRACDDIASFDRQYAREGLSREDISNLILALHLAWWREGRWQGWGEVVALHDKLRGWLASPSEGLSREAAMALLLAIDGNTAPELDEPRAYLRSLLASPAPEGEE